MGPWGGPTWASAPVIGATTTAASRRDHRRRAIDSARRQPVAIGCLRGMNTLIAADPCGPIPYRLMDPKERMRDIMSSMSQGRVGPLFDAMAEDVTWRWMGVSQWSRTFEGKQLVVDTLFGGARETLSPSSSVAVHCIHGDGDFVVIEHSGRNELADGRRYDNNYCWVFRFQDGLIQEVREYMDTQLVTETFGPDGSS